MKQHVALMALFLLVPILGCDAYESMKSKEEYYALQVVEHEHRSSPVQGVEMVRRGEFVIAGFRASNGQTNVWILLNSRHSPFFKRVPDVNFTVPANAIDALRKTPGASAEVLAELAKRTTGG